MPRGAVGLVTFHLILLEIAGRTEMRGPILFAAMEARSLALILFTPIMGRTVTPSGTIAYTGTLVVIKVVIAIVARRFSKVRTVLGSVTRTFIIIVA
ncbi:hypothetical protein EVA_16197 [gut metagenome]|uniref:Uncharacterized protein n=1 Tax=gut metagenome TaxID=749906 RepID=J9G1K5_9ZZZZ